MHCATNAPRKDGALVVDGSVRLAGQTPAGTFPAG